MLIENNTNHLFIQIEKNLAYNIMNLICCLKFYLKNCILVLIIDLSDFLYWPANYIGSESDSHLNESYIFVINGVI